MTGKRGLVAMAVVLCCILLHPDLTVAVPRVCKFYIDCVRLGSAVRRTYVK